MRQSLNVDWINGPVQFVNAAIVNCANLITYELYSDINAINDYRQFQFCMVVYFTAAQFGRNISILHLLNRFDETQTYICICYHFINSNMTELFVISHHGWKKIAFLIVSNELSRFSPPQSSRHDYHFWTSFYSMANVCTMLPLFDRIPYVRIPMCCPVWLS